MPKIISLCNMTTIEINRNRASRGEKAVGAALAVSAAFSVFAVFAIIIYLLLASLPAFSQIGVFNFIFGTTWAPLKDFLAVSDRFGILPMIVSSAVVTAGALAIGGTTGVFAAIFIVYFCPKKLKEFLTQVISLLAGIPSIIYGFFGLEILVPALAKISPTDDGMGVTACCIILGVMILPTVASITKNSLEAVPKNYFEGALALGSTREQAVFKVMFPSAKSGIATALALGMGRAVGETMAVLMIAGNSANFPTSPFIPIKTLTTNIVLEMGYATGLHRDSLIATGFVLLCFILVLNLCISLFKREKKIKDGKSTRMLKGNGAAYVYTRGGTVCRVLKWLSIVFSAAVIGALAVVVIFVLVKGVPNITWNLLTGRSGNAQMTLAPAFVSTGMLILLALAVALPIGVGAAIFLTEFSKKGSRFVKVIRLFTDTLAGIPSIVFGLFGNIFFCGLFGKYCLFAGGFTLALMILPTIVRSTEESLLAVSSSLREGSLALGASKVRTIFKIVLPSALSGILTAIILGVGRIVSESAALIYTAGAVPYMPSGYMDSGSSFAVMMWMFAGEGLYIDSAYATAAILLILVAVLNLLVSLVGKRKRANNA